MPLSKTRQAVISRQARKIWDSFLQKNEHKYHASSFFVSPSQTPRQVNRAVIDFCKFTAQIVVGRTARIAIVPFDLSNARVNDYNNPAVSWLGFSNLHSQQLNIYLDRNCLNEVPSELLGVVKHQAVFHEIGHLQHLEQLRAEREKQPIAGRLPQGMLLPDAKAEFEAEAWWFSFTIVGMSVAACACRKKLEKDPELPPVWKLIQHPSSA